MEHIAGESRVPAAHVPAELGFDAYKLAGTRRLIQKYIDPGKIAGAVSLVARRGQVAQLLAVGHAELESGTPMAPDTLFRIFSLTKPVTSVAALMLVERSEERRVGKESRSGGVADRYEMARVDGRWLPQP